MLKANFMIGFLVLLPLLSLAETTATRVEEITDGKG